MADDDDGERRSNEATHRAIAAMTSLDQLCDLFHPTTSDDVEPLLGAFVERGGAAGALTTEMLAGFGGVVSFAD